MKKILVLLLVAIAFMFVNGCNSGGSGSQPTSQPTPQAETPQNTAAARPSQTGDTSTYLVRFKFKTPDGAEALNIKRYADHDKIELNFEGMTAVFKGRTDVADRVKYKELAAEGNEKQLVAEVKIKPESVKLVDDKESLLWKIKFNEDKVKISNNEEGTGSCEIKQKESDKAEIRDAAGNEIGNVRYYSDNGKLKVKDAAGNEVLTTKDSKFSLAPGVILFKHIPLQQRVIMISEIMRQGR